MYENVRYTGLASIMHSWNLAALHARLDNIPTSLLPSATDFQLFAYSFHFEFYAWQSYIQLKTLTSIQ